MSKRIMPVLLSSILLLPAAAAPIAAQTLMKPTPAGTGRPPDINLPPGDARPSYNFYNDTGADICDFVIAVQVGARNVRGVLVRDPAQGAADYDVDDDENGQLDGGENAGAGAEPAGAPGFGHPDNSKAPGRTLRVEENGRDHCVGRNRNFTISLEFDGPPLAGDKITIQPTNTDGLNMYAWAGPIEREQMFALARPAQVTPGLSVMLTQAGATVSAIRVASRTPEVTIASVRTMPTGEFDATEGVVRFARPLDAALGIRVDATLSAMGTVAIAAILEGSGSGGEPGTGISATWIIGIVIVLAVLAVLAMRRRRA